MSDFIQDAQTIDFKTYDDGGAGDGLTRIQWRNGVPREKTGGYFFVIGERLGDFTPSAPWSAFTDTFDNGSTADGYKADSLRLAIIAVRQQPFVGVQQGEFKTKIWREKYAKNEPGASIQVDVLCAAEGLEELGMIVWSSATVKTGFAIVGKPDGIVHMIDSAILKPASALAKKTMRPWCFWATISTERDAQGKVVYTPTKGKTVTKPALILPKEVTKAWLVAAYTGSEMLRYGEEQRAAYDDWVRERRTNDAPATPAQPVGGRNVPQPIDDENLPF